MPTIVTIDAPGDFNYENVALRIRGEDRTPGIPYMTYFLQSDPAMYTNGYICMNAADLGTADTIPTIIAGEEAYMIGVNSDVNHPALVINTPSQQHFRLYSNEDRIADYKPEGFSYYREGSYVDSTNYEAGFFRWNSSIAQLEIGTESPGATGRDIKISTGSGNTLNINTGTINVDCTNAVITTGNLGVGSTADTKIGATFSAPNGDGIKLINSSADGSAKYGVLYQMGPTGFGVSDWPNALVMEASANGGIVLSSLQDSLKITTGTSRTTRMVIDSTTGNVGINETTPNYKLDVNGPIGFTPGNSVTPINVGDVIIEATSDTMLTFKLKGSDGVVRIGTVTLS